MRSLSPEEAELWARFAVTIRPLSRETQAPQPTERPQKAEAPAKLAKALPAPPPVPVTRTVPIGEGTLDGSWDKRLGSGAVQPDRVIDLHGMNLDTAWTAIDHALEQAIARGDRVVLLITGHHRPGEPPVRRGASAPQFTTGWRLRAMRPGSPRCAGRIAVMAEAAASISF